MNTGDAINLSVAKLRERCDPFVGCCWPGLDRPITVTEVSEAISNDNLAPPADYAFGKDSDNRAKHAARVAWFVVHGWDKPLGVDVGVPSMGCCPAWPVVDGNHRLAAAIYQNDSTIHADVSGSVDEIEKFVAAQESDG